MHSAETAILTGIIFSVGGIVAIIGLTAIISISFAILIYKNKNSSINCDNKKQCSNLFGTKTKEKCPALMQKDFNHLIILFAVIMVFGFTNILIGDTSAFEYISFASTITSIVLSVIAIFMTISSESKTDNIKIAIDESVRRLEETAENVRNYTERLGEQEQTIRDILEKTDKIDRTVAGFKQVETQNITSQKTWEE